MDQRKKVFQVLGPIVGFILLYYAFTSAASYLQQGQLKLIAEAEATPAVEVAGEAAAPEAAAEAPAADTASASTAAEPAAAVAAGEAVTQTDTITETSTEAVESPAEVTATTDGAATEVTTTTVASETGEAVSETGATDAATATEAPAPTATAEPTAEPTATPAPTEPPAVAAGPPVASELVIGAMNKGTCIACHVIPGVPNAVGQVGPDLTNIGAEAGTRVAGQSAVDYLHESIVDPNKFTAPKCPFGACVAGAMPANLATLLSAEEIDAVIEYLSQLQGGS